jgi:hypothetical protein
MCIPESEDDASTDMTGITTSFANHICCYDFRGAESKGGLMIDDMKGGEMVTCVGTSVKSQPHC